MEIAEGCRCTYPEGLMVTTSHYFHTGMTTLGSFYDAANFFFLLFLEPSEWMRSALALGL